jgi:mono/diheme cytochrome c family protein
VASVIVLVVVAFVILYQFDPLRAETLTLTVAAAGEMTPVQASAATTVPSTGTESLAANTQVDAAAVNLGQQLYSANCAACHGPNGVGIENLGTALAGSEMLKESDADVLALIRVGRAADDPS